MKIKLSTLPAIAVLACIAPGLANSAAPTAAPATPKLVLVLVVDGLPNEQVQRYRDQFGPGGFRRLLEQGASFSDAHQAHGVTVTAVGHTAVLTGAYPYQHGIIANTWIDPVTLKSTYCYEDSNFTYIGEESTKPAEGTAPTKLRVSTLGDELRYATGNQSKVFGISGKDRGAIPLAGKTGTAYIYMERSGNFASSSYYMASHPQWVQRYHAGKPQDRFYGKTWTPLLADSAYAHDAPDDIYVKQDKNTRFPFTFGSAGGKPDEAYYKALRESPYVDEMTLDFARAAIAGENLGKNPAGVPDLLGVSLSSHDAVNHAYGPESKMSHDHLQRLDRLLANFFDYLDKRIGMDNVVVVLTADHGFTMSPEFARSRHHESQRVESKPLVAALTQHLSDKFAAEKLVRSGTLPNILLDYPLIERRGLRRDDVENAAARFLMAQPGIANVFTRTQFESGGVADTRMAKLMRRAWNRQLSGDLMVVPKPFTYFGTGSIGSSHGTPYAYDTNVPLLIMGKRWIKPGYYGQYAEVVDIAPTLANLLHVRPPAAAEGRVLVELLK